MDHSQPFVIAHMGYPPAALRSIINDQPHWFRQTLGDGIKTTVVCPFLGESLPPPDQVKAVAITGSWSMVTDHEPWSEQTAEWIRQLMANDVPLLGVCYGHQLMAQALGGEVNYHPAGAEVGQKTLQLHEAALDEPLLNGFPTQFDAFLTHEQSVLTPPPNARVLASSGHDQHQIIRYTPRALSVQFHPEFSPLIMREIIKYRSQAKGIAPDRIPPLLENITDTPWSRLILQRFAQHYAS